MQIKRKCLFFFFVNLHWRVFSPLIFRDWKEGRRGKKTHTHKHTPTPTHPYTFPHSPWMGQEPAAQGCALDQTQTCDPSSMQEHWPEIFFSSPIFKRKKNKFVPKHILFYKAIVSVFTEMILLFISDKVSGGRVLYLFSFFCNIT